MSSAGEAEASETELKFEIGSASLAKLRKRLALGAGASRTSVLRSIYFDTAHHDLRNAGVSLRVREIEGRFVQTVKTRAKAGSIRRGEWETAIAAEQPDAEALSRTPAVAVLNGSGVSDLKPVFSTTVQRAVQLWEREGTLVEVALDEGEIKAGPDREPIRELELELKAGSPAALFSLAQEIARAAPIRLSFDSKAERGYRLAGHDRVSVRKMEQAAVSPSTATADAFRLVAWNCLAQIAGNAQLMRRVRSPQALHQARVGLRRLRAVLAAFRPVVGDERFDEIKREARWLARELDAARDLDVFIAATVKPDDDDLNDDPSVAAFQARLLSAQAGAHEHAAEAIDSPRFAGFLLETAAWIETGAWTDDPARGTLREQPVADFGAAALSRQHRKVRKAARNFAGLDAGARHRLRIQGKKLRYAADLFAGAFPAHPKRRARFFSSLKALQESLGELNDIAVSSRIALGGVGRHSPETAFAAGLVVGRRRRKEGAVAEQAGEALARFLDARPFWKT